MRILRMNRIKSTKKCDSGLFFQFLGTPQTTFNLAKNYILGTHNWKQSQVNQYFGPKNGIFCDWEHLLSKAADLSYWHHIDSNKQETI